MILFIQFLHALPFLALGATLCRRLFERLPVVLWIYGAVVLAMVGNLFPRSDWGHLVFVLPPAAAQLSIVLGRCRFRGRTLIAVGIVAVLSLGTAYGATALYSLASPIDLGPHVPLRAVSPAIKNDGLPRAIQLIRENTQPGDAIFVPRSEPLIYFATDTRNPTPFSGLIPGMREEQERAIVAGLDGVRFVVMSEIDQPLFLYYSDELPKVQDYLERHYQVRDEYLHGQTSWIVVYERSADRGPTLIDLVAQRAQARAWTSEENSPFNVNRDSVPRLGALHNRRPLPFRLGSRGGGVDFDILVPEGAIFQGDVALARVPDEYRYMHTHPRDTRLEVWVAKDGRFGRFECVASQAVLEKPGDGTHWLPVEVDLSAYVGREIALRLALASDHVIDPSERLAWWGSPRITQHLE